MLFSITIITITLFSQKLFFIIKKDENYSATNEDYQAQYIFLKRIRNKFFETQETLKNINGDSQKVLSNTKTSKNLGTSNYFFNIFF